MYYFWHAEEENIPSEYLPVVHHEHSCNADEFYGAETPPSN